MQTQTELSISTLPLPDRSPFVYVIRDVTNNKRYGGVKFAKGCKPSDLLSSYFTSSKIVKSLIASGREFVIDNIIEFDTKEEAIEFEELMLQMVNASTSEDWYNQAIGKAINPEVVKQTCLEKYGVASWMSTETAKQSGLGFKEGNTFGCFKRNEETKRRMSLAFTGRDFSEEHRRRISESKLGKKASEAVRLRMSESRQRGKHPRAIPIHTPDGNFDCIKDAAEFYGVSSGCIRKWLISKSDLFYKIV